MRKAAQILFLIGMILAIIASVSWFISGILCIIGGASPAFGEAVAKIISEAMESAHYAGDLTAEQLAAVIQGAYIGLGVTCIFLCAFSIACAVFASKAKNGHPTRAISVLNIVFGILSGTSVTVVGAIFALICDTKDQNKPQVIDNQAE